VFHPKKNADHVPEDRLGIEYKTDSIAIQEVTRDCFWRETGNLRMNIRKIMHYCNAIISLKAILFNNNQLLNGFKASKKTKIVPDNS
jgi:hypothetical protein